MKKIIVIDKPGFLEIELPGVVVISPQEYLLNPEYMKYKGSRVFNLSSNYGYQSDGYYVSLLAEARGHKPVPSVKNIQDLKSPEIVRIIAMDLDVLIQKSLKNIKSREFTLSLYFGKNLAVQYDKLCRSLHNLFPMPLLRVKFIKGQIWELQQVKVVGIKEIPESHLPYVKKFAGEFFSQKRHASRGSSRYLYDLGILINPEEANPPSNQKALNKFMELAPKAGLTPCFITKEAYSRIGEYDALFIRETTSVNHHTYRFARRAQSEGLIVLDDPDSILKCCNKVYLAELLGANKIPTPRTVVVHRKNLEQISRALKLPCVLKLPDSSFSLGVIKVASYEELMEKLNEMLRTSELVIAQEFLPSDFDWRIGFLGGKPLYACKYFMAPGHWQIYNWKAGKKGDSMGMAATVKVEEVPDKILNTARKAVDLIGRGLYGVDVKEIKGEPFVIEINDNPSLDRGIEDSVLQNGLYLEILNYFKVMIEKKYE